MELITLIVFLIPVVVARHNHRTVLESILKSTDNLYAKLHNDVQSVINNLFDRLNLSPSFPEKSRIKLFLTMHYDLNNVAANNYDEHIKMIDAARPDTGNTSSKGLGLFKLIEKTLSTKPFNTGLTILEDTIEQETATIPITTPISLEAINPSDRVFADSKEFLKFIKDFVEKVDKLNETDFSKSTPLLPPIEEITTEPDVEYWKPPEFENFNDTETRRIYKGKRSNAKTYPFIVSVHLFDVFVCAGSLLHDDLVITAASCLQLLHNNRFFRENPRAVEVRVGSDYFLRGGEVIPVLETFFYPSYDPKTLAHNLVLLRLTRHIRFSKHEKAIKKVRYDRTKGNLPANTNGVTVIGWGSRKMNNIIEQFERVMSAKLEVYQVDECASIYSRKYVTHKHFCAGFVSKGGGACNKDLGGPGLVGDILVGVISFGAPMCGAIDSPTVFTKLGYYDEWIDRVIEEHGRTLKVKTTHMYRTEHYFFEPSPPPKENPYITYTTPRGTVLPVTVYSESTQEEGEEELSLVFRGQETQNIQIQKLFPYTPTTRQSMLRPLELIRSILYEDYGIFGGDDVSDMFKSTPQTVDPKQHPLVNLSLFPLPGVHTRPPRTTTKKRFNLKFLTTTPGPPQQEYENDAKSSPSAEQTTFPTLPIPIPEVNILNTEPEPQLTTWPSPVTLPEPTEPANVELLRLNFYDWLRV